MSTDFSSSHYCAHAYQTRIQTFVVRVHNLVPHSYQQYNNIVVRVRAMPNRTLSVLLSRVWQKMIANHNAVLLPSLCTNSHRARVDWNRQVHAKWSGGGKYKYKVLDVMKQWEKAFVESKIQEPRASIQHIVAHVLKSRRVKVSVL